jgi:hypothetical protein
MSGGMGGRTGDLMFSFVVATVVVHNKQMSSPSFISYQSVLAICQRDLLRVQSEAIPYHLAGRCWTLQELCCHARSSSTRTWVLSCKRLSQLVLHI